MVIKFQIGNLRNAEYYQFIISAQGIFLKYMVHRYILDSSYNELEQLLELAKNSMALERRNELIRQKNEMDNYRDRLHRKLFNQLKTILYDDKDPRFDDAQVIMNVVKTVGNPNKLPENVQSAMLTTLGTKLEPLRDQLSATRIEEIVDNLLRANQEFIELEKACRLAVKEKKLGETTPAMSTLRKKIDPVYLNIVNVINASYAVPAKKEEYKELVTELNVLVAKYDSLLAARKREKKEEEGEVCEVCNK